MTGTRDAEVRALMEALQRILAGYGLAVREVVPIRPERAA